MLMIIIIPIDLLSMLHRIIIFPKCWKQELFSTTNKHGIPYFVYCNI